MTALQTILLCLALTILLGVPAAHARRAPETVVQDDALFLHGSEDEIKTGLQQAQPYSVMYTVALAAASCPPATSRRSVLIRRPVAATGSLSVSRGSASGTVRSEYGWCDHPSPGIRSKFAQDPLRTGRRRLSTHAKARRNSSGGTPLLPAVLDPIDAVAPISTRLSGAPRLIAG
ncbi:MAG TPA: hypothetical protein VG474_15065 [Solirubrobacteraceae bacterium]|nr:hypothetical protein [Solirubrobacteraceae bacterium]